MAVARDPTGVLLYILAASLYILAASLYILAVTS